MCEQNQIMIGWFRWAPGCWLLVHANGRPRFSTSSAMLHSHAVRLRDRMLASVTARIYVRTHLSHCLANRTVSLNVSRSRRSNVRRCFWELWTGGRAPSSPVGEMKLFPNRADQALHGKGANARIASLQRLHRQITDRPLPALVCLQSALTNSSPVSVRNRQQQN